MEVQEIANSVPMKLSLDGVVATRSFWILPPDTGEPEIVMADAFNLPDIPQWGDAHPDLQDIVVQGIQVRRGSSGDQNLFRVDAEYAPITPYGAPIDVWTDVTTKVAIKWNDTYRADPVAPANINSPGADDIGGTAVDVGGNPVSLMGTTQTFQLTHTMEGIPNMAVLFAATGRRNQVIWQGFEAGFLLYLGPSIDRINSEHYQVRHDFLYDNSAHLRQHPKPPFDQYGVPVLNDDKQVAEVQWVQPFPNLFNPYGLGIPI